MIGLVKSVGKEYAESGITVNALAPAVVMTPMVEAMDPAQVKYMTDKIPMKRYTTHTLFYTVEPLYSGHLWGTTFWPLYRDGLY